MVYVCDNCGSLFSRAGRLCLCPDCGKDLVRSANQAEQHEYASQMAQLIRKNCADGLRFPNTVVTEISMPDFFAFKLPATALQIDSDMVVEVSVEFGENAEDRNELTGNVWARREDGQTIRFLMSVYLPLRKGEGRKEQADRFFAALSGNEAFTSRLFDFVTRELEHGA